MNVRLTKAQKVEIQNGEMLYGIMQQVLMRENAIRRGQEHFWLIGLNNANRLIFVELVSLGSTNMVLVKPMEIYRMSVIKLVTKVILCHNHPSGKVIPSHEDFDITNRLIKSGEMLGLDVIDHLIISEKAYTSLAELGAIEKLKASDEYRIVGKVDAELQDLKIKHERRTAAKEADIATATRMLKDGFKPTEIRNWTALSIRDLNKLIKSLETK